MADKTTFTHPHGPVVSKGHRPANDMRPGGPPKSARQLTEEAREALEEVNDEFRQRLWLVFWLGFGLATLIWATVAIGAWLWF